MPLELSDGELDRFITAIKTMKARITTLEYEVQHFKSEIDALLPYKHRHLVEERRRRAYGAFDVP